MYLLVQNIIMIQNNVYPRDRFFLSNQHLFNHMCEKSLKLQVTFVQKPKFFSKLFKLQFFPVDFCLKIVKLQVSPGFHVY